MTRFMQSPRFYEAVSTVLWVAMLPLVLIVNVLDVYIIAGRVLASPTLSVMQLYGVREAFDSVAFQLVYEDVLETVYSVSIVIISAVVCSAYARHLRSKDDD